MECNLTTSYADEQEQNQILEKLSDSDRSCYQILKQMLTSSACKNRRNKSAETFQDVVDSIHAFVMRGDENDLNRGIACGMFWVNNDIAINTRQLRILLNKCKSSINGSLQMIGYSSPSSKTDTSTLLVNIFPFWKDNFRELRQWTIRRRTSGAVHSPKLLLNEFLQKTLSTKNSQKASILDSTIKSAAAKCYPTPPPTIGDRNEPTFEISVSENPQISEPFANDYEFQMPLDNEPDYYIKNDSFGLWDAPYGDNLDL